MDEEPKSGGDPQTFGVCTECGEVYPLQRGSDGEHRPIGTEGECKCGNEEFSRVSKE